MTTWRIKRNSYGEPSYHAQVGNYCATVWEVHSRPGHYQWSVVTADTVMSVASGDENMSDSLADAQAAAEGWLRHG